MSFLVFLKQARKSNCFSYKAKKNEFNLIKRNRFFFSDLLQN